MAPKTAGFPASPITISTTKASPVARQAPRSSASVPSRARCTAIASTLKNRNANRREQAVQLARVQRHQPSARGTRAGEDKAARIHSPTMRSVQQPPLRDSAVPRRPVTRLKSRRSRGSRPRSLIAPSLSASPGRHRCGQHDHGHELRRQHKEQEPREASIGRRRGCGRGPRVSAVAIGPSVGGSSDRAGLRSRASAPLERRTGRERSSAARTDARGRRAGHSAPVRGPAMRTDQCRVRFRTDGPVSRSRGRIVIMEIEDAARELT